MGEQITEDRPYIFALGKARQHFFLHPVINWKSNFGLGAAGERKGEYHKGFQRFSNHNCYENVVLEASACYFLQHSSSQGSQMQKDLQDHQEYN